MAERVCEIVAFSEISTSGGGIVKGGPPPLCLYPPLTRQNMDKYRVSVFNFEWYEGHRILECVAFSIDPLDSLEDVVSWIKQLPNKPDHIRINYVNGGCLFDNEDTRIMNNVFYCKKFE